MLHEKVEENFSGMFVHNFIDLFSDSFVFKNIFVKILRHCFRYADSGTTLSAGVTTECKTDLALVYEKGR